MNSLERKSVANKLKTNLLKPQSNYIGTHENDPNVEISKVISNINNVETEKVNELYYFKRNMK